MIHRGSLDIFMRGLVFRLSLFTDNELFILESGSIQAASKNMTLESPSDYFAVTEADDLYRLVVWQHSICTMQLDISTGA